MRALHNIGELLPSGLGSSRNESIMLSYHVSRLRDVVDYQSAAQRVSLGSINSPSRAAKGRLYRKKAAMTSSILLTTSLYQAFLSLQSFINFSSCPHSLSPSFITFKSSLLLPLQTLFAFPPTSVSFARLLTYQLRFTILFTLLVSRSPLSIHQRL